LKYYLDTDYFVRIVPFPNNGADGCAISNGDGTFTIFINANVCNDRQAKALDHELRHLIKEHFYRDEPITKLEGEANEKDEFCPLDRVC